MDQDFRPNFPGEQHYRDDHNDYPYHRQHEGEPIFSHQHNQMNAERNDSFGGNCGAGGHGHGRRRDQNDGGATKLYAQPVSRTATEEDLLSIFGEHGHVTEVILPRDKQTGEQHAYCFVKYATFEEARQAIFALNNCVTFPGESASLQVRFAVSEKENRGGLPQDKLYVRGFTKNTTYQEFEEAFSPYGHIEDIYILRNQFKEIRGGAFVQYSRREMAIAAIKALNGMYFMRNCDQPLIVKFADPKRPRNGQIRCMPNIQNPMPPYASPNGPYPVQHHPSNFQGQGGSYWGSFGGAAPNVAQLPHPCVHQAPIQTTHFPPQQTQIQQGNCQSPQQSVREMQKHQPPSPASLHNLGPYNDSLPANIEFSQAGTSEMRTDPSAASKAPGSPENVASLECDWSEHTCPDGYKYYYNCVTCESSWDKPEELTIFESQLKKPKKMQNPSQHIQSCVQAHSVEQVSKNQEFGVLGINAHITGGNEDIDIGQTEDRNL